MKLAHLSLTFISYHFKFTKIYWQRIYYIEFNYAYEGCELKGRKKNFLIRL